MKRVPGDVLVPLRDRLQEWVEWDEAAFFLGKLLGVFPANYSFGNAKGALYYGAPEEAGAKILRALYFLSDIGILESRDSRGEFRWPQNSADVPDSQAVTENDDDGETGTNG